ncbi:MAG TPA: DegT/DnrJ/EryC1/StrS family aminotransferase, partial [Candidatus Binataceae bacterium]|nr:DegT/DnrJ/EryC1/StrS family aminotransferase [Candidatus Binataceae bacterium]
RAILCVHQVGMPANLEAVGEIARRHSIPLVEDAACAIGSEISWNGKWEMIGKPHGDIACFSFHPRKLLTTGDGGMVTTANPEFDRKCRLLRQHAMSASASERHQSGKVTFEEYPEIGYNYRMTDIQAAIGREQLRRLPKMITRRRELAARYNRILSEVTGVTLPFEPPFARSNWQSYLVRLPETVGQKETMQFMLDRGVATRRGVMCCHREPAYRDNRNFRVSGSLGESESAQEHAIILPLFHQMTEAEQDRVAEVLSESLAAMSPAKSARRS